MAVKKLIIDEFEGQWAVVDYNGYHFNVPKHFLPAGAKKGDILTIIFGMNQEDTDPFHLRNWNEATY